MEQKLGEKVRLRRKQLGLTLKELAGDRVTAAQISAIEKGKCNPSSGLLSYIAEKLMVEPDYFMYTEDERNRKKFENIKAECQKKCSDGDIKAAREYMENAKGMLVSLTDGQKGFYYGIIGNSMYEDKNYKDAFSTYIKAITYYNKAKESKEILDIYFKAGSCLAKTGNHAVAMGYYKTVMFYGDKNKNKRLMERTLYNMALCCTTLKRNEEASYYIIKLEEAISEEDEKYKETYIKRIIMLKGAISYNQKNYAKGLEYFDKAMSMYADKDNSDGLGGVLNNYGLCLVEMGRENEALEYFNKAIKCKGQVDDSFLVESYVSVATIYEKQGKWDKALETISGAEEYILAKDINEQAGAILIAKFRYLYELEDYDKAEIFAFLALDCIQKTHDTKEEAKLYLLIAKMYEKMGDEKNTLTYLSKANKLI